MSNERKNPIRNNEFFKYVSTKKYLKIFVPGFAFKHDNDFADKDKFVGREVQFRRLYMWLTSDSKSGSYLVTGYRGMGKSLLVNRVLHMICRPQKEWKELAFKAAELLAFVSCFIFIVANKWYVEDIYSKIGVWAAVVSGLCIAALWLSKVLGPLRLWYKTIRWQWGHRFNKDHLAKYVLKMDDGRDLLREERPSVTDPEGERLRALGVDEGGNHGNGRLVWDAEAVLLDELDQGLE